MKSSNRKTLKKRGGFLGKNLGLLETNKGRYKQKYYCNNFTHGRPSECIKNYTGFSKDPKYYMNVVCFGDDKLPELPADYGIIGNNYEESDTSHWNNPDYKMNCRKSEDLFASDYGGLRKKRKSMKKGKKTLKSKKGGKK